MNMQDFYTGHAFDAYEFFGAHTYFGGTHFAVWAPSAQHIAVETEIGTFDLHRTQSAVWECDAPGVQAGMVYQYWVRGANGDGRSIVSDAPKGFADDKWMQERTKCFDKPLNIYEVHAGSWRQKEDGSWYTYAELADLLPAYCKKNGFTHIELMPLAEHQPLRHAGRACGVCQRLPQAGDRRYPGLCAGPLCCGCLRFKRI